MAQGDVLADFDQYYVNETKVNPAFAGQGLHLQIKCFWFGFGARITTSTLQKSPILPAGNYGLIKYSGALHHTKQNDD